MIPTLIYLMFRRFQRQNPQKAEQLLFTIRKTSRLILLFLIATAIALQASPQERKLEYQIKRNGNVVGNVHFMQSLSGSRVTMKMESEVKTRFIFTFTAKAQEESIYDNGILTWSSLYRKMNGNVKADQKMKAAGNAYTVYKNNKSETINQYPIYYNMLSMYTIEPSVFSKVYSDNFQQFLEIKTVKEHHYKIEFPDGNYNEYFYEKGVCSKISIHHSLYSATIELKS